MTNEEFEFILAQVLLIDPMSDKPKIHSKRKTMPKQQMLRRLEKMIQAYEEAEVDVDLSLYKKAVERIKSIRSDREYRGLIQEIVNCYDPNYGVMEKNNTENHSLPEVQDEEKQKENDGLILKNQPLNESKDHLQENWFRSIMNSCLGKMKSN